MSDRPHCRAVDACVSTGKAHCPSCAASMRATPEYRQKMSDAKKRALQDPEKRARVAAAARQIIMVGRENVDFSARRRAFDARLTPEQRSKLYGRPSKNSAGLIGEDRIRYRKLVHRGVGAAKARAQVDHERREAFEAAAAAMRAKHERQKAQEY